MVNGSDIPVSWKILNIVSHWWKKPSTQKCPWASDESEAATGKNQHAFIQMLTLAFCITATEVSQIFHCKDMFTWGNGDRGVKWPAPAHKLSGSPTFPNSVGFSSH